MSELARLDAQLASRAAFHTLEPGRTRARSLTEVVARVLAPVDDPALADAFEGGLVQAVDAMLTAFPDNLLWDIEALAQRQLDQARAADDPPSRVRALWQRVGELQHLFGVQGPIRFRYIHDFIYGFDWAKWVAKAPQTRAQVGPYDAAFVERMHRRGGELLSLIAAGDAKYGPLTGPGARNPFSFSREPADELALHHRLADEGSLPVLAWRGGVQPDWQRPYAQLRERAAQALRASA